jgi:hypothetical protein
MYSAANSRIFSTPVRATFPGEQVRANPLANQTFANPAPHGAREVPGPPVRFARLQMAMPEGLCWRPIQARAISQTAFDAWGRP